MKTVRIDKATRTRTAVLTQETDQCYSERREKKKMKKMAASSKA